MTTGLLYLFGMIALLSLIGISAAWIYQRGKDKGDLDCQKKLDEYEEQFKERLINAETELAKRLYSTDPNANLRVRDVPETTTGSTSEAGTGQRLERSDSNEISWSGSRGTVHDNK